MKPLLVFQHIGCETPGIFLGSQLIAKPAGGEIRQGPRKEIGWYPVRLTTAARRV